MSHARESLAALLTKPGKRRHVGSSNDTSYLQMVSKLLPDIEAYRERGYSLGEIHGALVRGGDIGCTVGTFKAYYYRSKRLAGCSSSVANQPVKSSEFSQESDLNQISQTSYGEDESLAGSSSLQVPNALVDSVPDAEPEQKSLLNISETELKAQQALAKQMFAQRRAELGMRRRDEP